MDLETAAKIHRLRTIKLEDGEVVIPLRGWKKKASYPSNNPHAGVWGVGIWYALIPTRSPARTAGAALAYDTLLDPHTSDDAVLIHGSPATILMLITKGPIKFRAYQRRSISPEAAAKLVEVGSKHRFTGLRSPETA